MAQQLGKLYDVLQSLIDSEDWPVITGSGGREIYFANQDNVSKQIEAFWYYVVDGKSVKQIAENCQITPKAAWKRVEKIRNWLATLLTDDWGPENRLRAVARLQQFVGLDEQTALRAMTLNNDVIRKFAKRAKRKVDRETGGR